MKRRRFIKIAGIAASAFGINGTEAVKAANTGTPAEPHNHAVPGGQNQAAPSFDKARFERKLADFEPSFYSVRVGRKNDAQGIGHSWYERLKILHISDTHQYNALVEEAMTLAQGRFDVVCNTGDDGNGSNKVERGKIGPLVEGSAVSVIWGSEDALFGHYDIKVNDIACSALEIDTVEKCVYRVSYGSYMSYDAAPVSRITKIPYRF